ncbi:hypothetical protein IFM89_010225, partial [Coptis chinensis]
KQLELAGTEISKLRTNVLKFQQQNQLLAQTNAQITIVKRTRDKDRIKVLQHELGCKVALLIIKDVELQEKVKKEPCQMPQTAKTTKRKCEEIKGEVGGDKKPCTRRQSRSQSLAKKKDFAALAASAVGEQVDAKEEAGNKREELKGEVVQADASDKKACNAIRKRQSRTQFRQGILCIYTILDSSEPPHGNTNIRDNIIVLGIETSCGDTAAAVVRSNGEILSQVVSSQADLLEKYGGVAPKMAEEAHSQVIDKVVQQALDEADLTVKDLTAVVVTIGPGLNLCLCVGVWKAQKLAGSFSLPIIGIHHLEAHALVARPDDEDRRVQSLCSSFRVLATIE